MSDPTIPDDVMQAREIVAALFDEEMPWNDYGARTRKGYFDDGQTMRAVLRAIRSERAKAEASHAAGIRQGLEMAAKCIEALSLELLLNPDVDVVDTRRISDAVGVLKQAKLAIRALAPPAAIDTTVHGSSSSVFQDLGLPDPTPDRDEAIRGLVEAVKRIAAPISCGCVPCRGQCRSEFALKIQVDEYQDDAAAALTAATEARLPGTEGMGS